MKTYILLSVEITDFETWKPYPGALEFSTAFKDYKQSKTHFKFYDETICQSAISFFRNENLNFTKYHGLELETGEEIQQHPCFFISFSSDYNVVLNEDGTKLVDIKKMKSQNFKTDAKTGKLVFSKKAKLFFEEEVEGIQFEKLTDISGKRDFYCFKNLETAESPIYLKHATNIVESKLTGDDKKFEFESDGRVYLQESGIAEIQKNKLAVIDKFNFEKITYAYTHNPLICSGEFVSKIIQKFKAETEGINITPLTLHYT